MIGIGFLVLFVMVFVTYGEETHEGRQTWLTRITTCRGRTTRDRENA